MINSFYPGDFLIANGTQDQPYADALRGAPQGLRYDYLVEFTNTFDLNGEDTPSLPVDPRALSNQPQPTFPNTSTADASALSGISEFHHHSQAKSIVSMPDFDELFGSSGDNSAMDFERNEVQDLCYSASDSTAAAAPAVPAPSYDDEHSHSEDNMMATDSADDSGAEEETIDYLVDNNEDEEDDDPNVEPIDVFGECDPDSASDEKLKKAAQGITQYSDAYYARILKKRRFLIARRVRSILGMAKMRYESDIASADLTDFEKAALQAACLVCRNRYKLFEGRLAQKHADANEAATVKAPARRGRKPKVVNANNQDKPASARIRKTKRG